MFNLFSRFASSRRKHPRSRALALLERGDFVAAIAELTTLLESAAPPPERAFLLNKRGVARIGLGERAAARHDFEAALAFAPHAPALVNLGNLALEENCVEEAVSRYEAAIALDAEYPIAHFNLGVAYKRLGRIEEAVRALRTAQKLEGRSGRKPRTGR